MTQVYGYTSVPSTSRKVSFIEAKRNDSPGSIVGKLVYFDTVVDGETYRAIGTVSNMTTLNTSLNALMEGAIAGSSDGDFPTGTDLRKSEFVIQAVFRKDQVKGWTQDSSSLRTSPSSKQAVCLLEDETVEQMLQESQYPSVGFFRGMGSAPIPFNIPNYDRSGYHGAVLGRSGSGKTQLYGMVLGGYMRHENHAILVIDPQGQWANENGMIFSPQNFARALGRDVSILRVAEDIQLPMDADAITKMIEKLQVWRRFRRMGNDQVEAFSQEVADRFAQNFGDRIDRPTKTILTEIFSEIANSNSSLSRIYVPGDRQDRFRDELKLLVGEPIINDEGEERIVTAAEEADADAIWENVLYAFEPLHNLFSSKNLDDSARRPLGGERGFLTNVFQVRKLDDANFKPAPYVVLDMSPNVANHAKAGLMKKDINLQMQKVLDNQDIKAIILMMVMEEMKRASEIAFASGTGLLNTQIVFDEAWRYAPEGRATPEIEALANMLEGFALDTRKFGIGWTYILQSPSDLKKGIWRQLTYVYAGYGLVGEDVRSLEGLTDDPGQIDLYRQFISPTATGTYPFMVMGPISPLIFTTAPTFLNAFNGNEEFLAHNAGWIRQILTRQQQPMLTIESLVRGLPGKPKTVRTTDVKHRIGRSFEKAKPQIAPQPIDGTRIKAEVDRVILDADFDTDPDFSSVTPF